MNINEENLAFNYTLGSAITAWAHVEWGVAGIAQISLKSESHQGLAVAFLAIENFRSKLEFTRRAFNMKFNGHPRHHECIALLNKIGKLAARRNQIVHRMVVGFPQAAEGRRYALVPALVTEPKIKTKVPTPPAGALCVRDIDLLRAEFFHASTCLLDIGSDLYGGLHPFSLASENQPVARSLDEMTDLIRRLGAH